MAKNKQKGRREKGQRRERNIVRLMSTDLNGDLPISEALRSIKGVGFAFAKAICHVIDMDMSVRTADLSEDQLAKIEEVVQNPGDYDLPPRILNLRKDIQTGEDRHLTGADLDVHLRQRLSALMKHGSYRGWRHRHGQPVRGQRTRSSFRGKSTIGVIRSKAREQAEE